MTDKAKDETWRDGGFRANSVAANLPVCHRKFAREGKLDTGVKKASEGKDVFVRIFGNGGRVKVPPLSHHTVSATADAILLPADVKYPDGAELKSIRGSSGRLLRFEFSLGQQPVAMGLVRHDAACD